MLKGSYFYYNSQNSKDYNLMLADLNADITTSTTALSLTLHTTKPQHGVKFYHNGVTADEPIQHTFTVFSNSEILATKRCEILTWLLDPGINVYGILEIKNSGNVSIATYPCRFTNADAIFIDGRCYGFKLTALFPSPYVHDIQSFYFPGPMEDHEVDIEVDAYDEYVYPYIQFSGNSLSIVNKTVSPDEVFQFSGCDNDSNVIIDNESRIVRDAYAATPMLSKFQGQHWLKLKPGLNRLSITCATGVSIGYAQKAIVGF